jgi:hypothetical protein
VEPGAEAPSGEQVDEPAPPTEQPGRPAKRAGKRRRPPSPPERET